MKVRFGTEGIRGQDEAEVYEGDDNGEHEADGGLLAMSGDGQRYADEHEGE